MKLWTVPSPQLISGLHLTRKTWKLWTVPLNQYEVSIDQHWYGLFHREVFAKLWRFLHPSLHLQYEYHELILSLKMSPDSMPVNVEGFCTSRILSSVFICTVPQRNYNENSESVQMPANSWQECYERPLMFPARKIEFLLIWTAPRV